MWTTTYRVIDDPVVSVKNGHLTETRDNQNSKMPIF
jgi:hypothetical protein